MAVDRQQARIEAHRQQSARGRSSSKRQLADVWQSRAAAELTGTETDPDLCALAERRAVVMTQRIDALDAAASLDWLNDQTGPMHARPFAFAGARPELEQIAGMLKRAQCELWWRRQLRRAVVRIHEAGQLAAGRVCARARQWYVTDATVKRRGAQLARNAAILAATELENDDGQVYTLAALVEKSPACKAIRRGELMTRIRGCEEWAEASEHVGSFLTLTAPSRFHAQLRHGGANPNHQGATPRDAHEWLCATWAKARAKLARIGVQLYGFRVAEPHHDGCPHWHALVWSTADHMAAALVALRAWWLKDSGDEPGAAEHRFKAVEMQRGGAAGYIAKYIAKNIDDAGSIGTEGHTDDGETLRADTQGNLFGDRPAHRVESWAAAWGIRQFQAIGQPPVTVWRELRRIDAQTAQGGTQRVQQAHAAVHRDGDKRACWRAYMAAQGGTNTGRGYVVRMAVQPTEHEGRYEALTVDKPMGVCDAALPEMWLLSNRRKWKPRGEWKASERGPKPRLLDELRGLPARPFVPPWTRFNNCTRPSMGRVVTELLDRLRPPESPNVGTLQPLKVDPHVRQTNPPGSRSRSAGAGRNFAERIRAFANGARSLAGA